ncbi:MAG: glycoside hydrolase family protein [Spirulina sp. SIO3F2]|nr:glycoside hydrolase family protein [Spirulina sp. SIO3F2]
MSLIWEMGNTGNSTGPHLHLQLRDGGEFVEPKKGHVIAVLSPPSHPTLANVTELVMELEGFRAQPYWDYQQWTVGYGTRAQSKTETVDHAEAKRRLEADLARRSQTLERLVQVPLSANQRAALISFIFNVGDGAFERSRLLRKLNAGDYAGAANEFDIWVYVKDGAEKSAGLVKRRQREKLLFLKG